MARGETNTMTQQVRYSRYMQLRMEEVRLNREHEEWKELLKNLNKPHLTFASHKDTAVVYDISIINKKLIEIDNRLKEIDEELT